MNGDTDCAKFGGNCVCLATVNKCLICKYILILHLPSSNSWGTSSEQNIYKISNPLKFIYNVVLKGPSLCRTMGEPVKDLSDEWWLFISPHSTAQHSPALFKSFKVASCITEFQTFPGPLTPSATSEHKTKAIYWLETPYLGKLLW